MIKILSLKFSGKNFMDTSERKMEENNVIKAS